MIPLWFLSYIESLPNDLAEELHIWLDGEAQVASLMIQLLKNERKRRIELGI